MISWKPSYGKLIGLGVLMIFTSLPLVSFLERLGLPRIYVVVAALGLFISGSIVTSVALLYQLIERNKSARPVVPPPLSEFEIPWHVWQQFASTDTSHEKIH